MGRAPCNEDKEGLKKGAWTAEEDEKLISFIRKNKGHGSWRTLPKLAGLERCGKSCRLRWTNYLRPNIKRGNFSAEEERMIIQLHRFMGNKWSTIASHLPGRTDNEVKNHWNTHLKKRLTKMGIDPMTHLPLQFLTPHNNQDAANYYGLLNGHSQPSFHHNSFDDWRMALLQRCLQVDPTTIARQLAQWELARLESEARLQLAASSHANLQHYASNWLQSLQQSQAPGRINANDLLLQAALSLQLQATLTASNSASLNAPSAPLQPPQYCEANEEQLLMKEGDSWDRQDNQPIASCCKLDELYGSASSRGAPHASESGPVHTSTSGMATPETCSSENTSQLLCELPDLLSSTEEVLPSLNVPLSPPSLADQYDAIPLHDSYWNKMLNLLGPATCTLDA